MSIAPKQFQQSTIDVALRTLNAKSGARRFLVADEVGLGKTVVASGIIASLAERAAASAPGPFSVLYVCSNQAISRQNTLRLLSYVPKEERKSAIAHVDRPSLLPTRERPAHKQVNIYMLTPDTAIPTRNGQRRDGRMEERALALVFLQALLKQPSKRLYRAFQSNAGGVSFRKWVKRYRQMAAERKLGNKGYRAQFSTTLCEILGLEQVGQHLQLHITKMLDEKHEKDLIAACRTALTVAGLVDIGAALVIFDEFQRFRDLLDDVAPRSIPDRAGAGDIRERAAASVLMAVRGQADGTGPALLLLSATPYTPYRSLATRSGARASTSDQSSDFFELVSFLAGVRGPAEKAKELFLKLSEELRKGVLDCAQASTLRNSLMTILLPLMSRTERPQLSEEQAGQQHSASVIDASLLPCDVSQFQEMATCFTRESYDWLVPLWQSVPLPMQSLGTRYTAWRFKAKMPDHFQLTKSSRDKHRIANPWPHPRLRALIANMSDAALSMPWTAPSLPWWPLRGGWNSGKDDPLITGKALVFSRFKAVPTAVAGLISFATESRLLSREVSGRRRKVSYENASKRHWLQASPDRPNLLELFHPCRLLADLDPLVAPLGDLAAMKKSVQRQLVERLATLEVRIVPDKKVPRRKPWELLVALENKADMWFDSQIAWNMLASETRNPASKTDDSRLETMIARWDGVADDDDPIGQISRETDLPALVNLAMTSPGVVLLRALARHWPAAMAGENQLHALRACWGGLRTYLDKAWFVSVLVGRSGNNYPEAIHKAVLDGNLESVLDEHFWFLSTDGSGDWPERLIEFEKSLRLRDAAVAFHESDVATRKKPDHSTSFSVRCHVAVPLTDSRKSGAGGKKQKKDTTASPSSADLPLRPDEVRKAFNTPFWPMVLVTTSIGQEGLDLHPWCSSLAHWDLATSAIALEQREGRITRFASLAVRKAIAKELRPRLTECHASPWTTLAEMAEETLCDTSGLSPWWIVKGSKCNRIVLAVPGGEQLERFEALVRERALYRLVLGMPDQADLLQLLDAEGRDPAVLRNACIDLSAFNNRLHI